MKLNRHAEIRHSKTPRLRDRKAWRWHNVYAHLAIGLWPSQSTFVFHDITSVAMFESDWL
jgi:hypothetical protein